MKTSFSVIFKVKFDVANRGSNEAGERGCKLYRNFLFFALHCFTMRATFNLHSSIAFSSSTVTSSPGLVSRDVLRDTEDPRSDVGGASVLETRTEDEDIMSVKGL